MQAPQHDRQRANAASPLDCKRPARDSSHNQKSFEHERRRLSLVHVSFVLVPWSAMLSLPRFRPRPRFRRILRPRKTNRASTKSRDPARTTIAKRIFQKVDDQFDTIGVPASDVVVARLVLDWHGIVGVIRPLAEVERVSAPVQQASSRIEIVVTSPTALDVFLVVRSPRRRAKPHVPVTDCQPQASAGQATKCCPASERRPLHRACGSSQACRFEPT